MTAQMDSRAHGQVMVNVGERQCEWHCMCRGGEGILGALGLMGLGGLGGPRGPQEAPHNVQARAAGGDPFAMVELGNWLVNGDRVPQNYEQVRSTSG